MIHHEMVEVGQVFLVFRCDDLGTPFMRYLLEDPDHGPVCAGHQGAMFRDDVPLFSDNFFKGISQVVRMFQGNVRDDGKIRGTDVHSISLSAHAHLHDRNPNVLFPEILQRGTDLELEGGQAIVPVCEPHHQSRILLGKNRSSVDLYLQTNVPGVG